MTEPDPLVPRFAIIDTETTGFSKADRILEFACLTVVDGEILDEYETLIQPGRDPGPVHVHGITPTMLQAAPPFEAVVADIATRLHGAVLAAHNISFDLRMLAQETARLANTTFDPGDGVCTYRLTRQKLAIAAQQVGLGPVDHTALGDARAVAGLLKRLEDRPADGRLRTARCTTEHTPNGITVRRPGAPRRRGSLHRVATSTAWPGTPEAPAALYLDALDRCLDDGDLDRRERRWLDATAAALGISRAERVVLHGRYYDLLQAQILADGTVTEAEESLAQSVADALALTPEQLRGHQAPSRSLELAPGTKVCFTGTAVIDGEKANRELLEKIALMAGLLPVNSVTRRCGLLVAADPLSQSTKTRRARSLDIPIIGVDEFLEAI